MPRSIRWYFDFVSPFAWLHWSKVRALMADTDVEPVPVLFGAVLDARGQLGPAEIPGKREFTYRHALWQARHEGVPLVFPPAHPFNPVAALRLCIAAGSTADAIDAIFRWTWAEGRAADGIEALAPLCARLQVAPERLSDPAVKQALRANTDAALQAGVFGVPTLAIGDALFWGNDAHAFALATLRDPGVLEDPEMRRVAMLPVGVRRR
ncbi:MAG TPA: 2-hydroxychromene-2-carboxylate isomerase [Xanthomonadaceae bacterium]|nr:2-hydroxychromene-2-carboxylate isomerase [Xanthomonadaceae bacterium]